MSTRSQQISAAPPQREDAPDIAHESDRHRLVRERVFLPSQDLMKILMHIRRKGITGRLMIDLNCGGIGSIRLCEEHRIEFE